MPDGVATLGRYYLMAMLNIDLTDKRALVAGVADDGGFGFAIAKLAFGGLRVSEDAEREGLDIATHGETAYQS